MKRGTNCQSSGSRQSAMTLIEALTVIAIVTLIAATVSAGLAAADSSAQILKTFSAIRDTDYRARIHARTSGEAVVISVSDRQLQCSMGRAVIMDYTLPADLDVEIVTEACGNGVTIDRQGRSDDYQIVIGSGTHQRRWQVCGLSGFTYEKEPNR